ncbi:hypothetical protein ACFE04_016109 [Oxalis oulophora]
MKKSRSNNNSNKNLIEENPKLTGAYIRNLVKQLSSSSSKPSSTMTSPSPPQKADQAADIPTKSGKKQVRRRLHTSRPYQERLLNMAEARREIVTALKYHRASMKQQQEKQNQNQQEQIQTPPRPINEREAKLIKSQRIYPSQFDYQNYHHAPAAAVAAPFYWPPPPLPPPIMADPLDFPLPHQTLGLNLNFGDFDTSSISYSSPNISIDSSEEVHESSYSGDGLMHQGMEGPEDMMMAEIRSIGDQHEMEWNDKMNLVTSAWWFKFLKTMELGHEDQVMEDELGSCYHPFDQVMEFPSWLNNDPNEQHFEDYCTQDYPSLPCMDIGEIEGMEDGEWLS